MNPIILVVLLAGGGADSVSMQRFETVESCEAVGGWLQAEHYIKAKSGAALSWKCYRGDWKPATPAPK